METWRRPAWHTRVFAAAGDRFIAEQDRWFLWIPVILASGVAIYFALPREPVLAAPAGLLTLAAIAAWRSHARGVAFAGFVCMAMLAAGMTIAKLRADQVAAPVLGRILTSAEVSGWIERAEPREGGRARLLLWVAAIDRLKGDEAPRRILVTLRQAGDAPPLGSAVRLKAFLQPPPAAPQPGGYDFARMAWFDGIGAVGMAHRAPQAWADAPPAPLMLRLLASIGTLRAQIAERITAGLAGRAGIIAAALITGLRGGIPADSLEVLRAAGLAHILAISGLHMTLMAGSLFWVVRAALAAIPALALGWPIKKIAASVALAGAVFYLVLSGASVATQRAFIMIAIMLVAVMADRAALSMRNVALAAVAVIVVAPESVLSASFQMSFAAVVSLIAAYEYQNARARRRGDPLEKTAHWPLWQRAGRTLVFYFAGIVLTTLVASAATAPFAAYHFHRVAPFSIIGNLLAMPVVALLVMPAALFALIAIPFGLEPVPLWLMGKGIDWVLGSAGLVAALPGADAQIAQISAVSLIMMVFGVLWLVLWRQNWRYAGFAVIGLAGAGAFVPGAPDILIGDDGAQIAVRSGEARRFSVLASNPDSFTVSRWLESDGDSRTGEAVTADAFSCDSHACIAHLPDGGVLAVVKHRSALEEECGKAEILVTAFRLKRPCDGPRLVLDARQLKRHGAHAIWLGDNGLSIRSVRPEPGARPWQGRPTQTAPRFAPATRSPPPRSPDEGQPRMEPPDKPARIEREV